MSDFTEVRLNAERYGVDVQFRMNCPACGNRERSFAATLRSDGVIVYICHRSKCGVRGALLPTNGVIVAQDGEKVKKPAPREMMLRPLAEYEKDMILKKWNFGPTYHSIPVYWHWDAISDRLAMPVTGPINQLRGYVLRTFKTFTKPKVLTVKFDHKEPMCHWAFPPGLYSEYVLVEDIPSAEMVSKTGRVGIALLGTYISPEMMNELSGQKTVTIALDEDASEKALEYQRQMALRFTRVKVMLLHQDLKDMPIEEVAACLREI